MSEINQPKAVENFVATRGLLLKAVVARPVRGRYGISRVPAAQRG